jgi:hypothetical protein
MIQSAADDMFIETYSFYKPLKIKGKIEPQRKSFAICACNEMKWLESRYPGPGWRHCMFPELLFITLENAGITRRAASQQSPPNRPACATLSAGCP